MSDDYQRIEVITGAARSGGQGKAGRPSGAWRRYEDKPEQVPD